MSPSKEALLIQAALRWLDTPWMPNSEAVGVGVACHNLPRAVLVESGLLPQTFPKVIGNPAQSRSEKTSRMVEFMDSRPEFVRVSPADAIAGDVLGIRIYRTVDHLGLHVGGNRFIHVLMHKKTCMDSTKVWPWSERITEAWRVKE